MGYTKEYSGLKYQNHHYLDMHVDWCLHKNLKQKRNVVIKSIWTFFLMCTQSSSIFFALMKNAVVHAKFATSDGFYTWIINFEFQKCYNVLRVMCIAKVNELTSTWTISFRYFFTSENGWCIIKHWIASLVMNKWIQKTSVASSAWNIFILIKYTIYTTS